MPFRKIAFFIIFCFLSVSTCLAQDRPVDTGNLRITYENSMIDSLIAAYQEHAALYPYIDGYRVQIYNGSKEKCLERRADFLKQYPEASAYLLYESPEYRTQVGDFRTRLEAEAFLRKILNEFRGSLVVRTQIHYPKL
jgi:hypothetical protein